MKNNPEDTYPKRGAIYWVKLDPTCGSESTKTRPGLIVSNNIGNQESNLVMIAPITTKTKYIYPFEVATEINGKMCKIMLNQCRAVDKMRLLNQVGFVDQDTLDAVEKAIMVVFGLN